MEEQQSDLFATTFGINSSSQVAAAGEQVMMMSSSGSDSDNSDSIVDVSGNGSGTQQSTWSLLLSALFLNSQTKSLQLNWSNSLLALILIMLMLTTAIGNLFVIVAILIERNLRTIGNYLVLSLAIADLLVACLVMPLAGIYQILERWTLGVLLCDIWTSADVFCCTASILHLLAIALDRYWAVTRVDYIRCQRNERRILFMIFFVWMAACVISLAPVLGWKDAQFEWRITNDQECLISQDIGYQIFATCTTFYFPLTLTLVFYWKIYQVARKRIRRKPGNRVQISLQHPSSTSSNSSPGLKAALQHQQQRLINQQQQQQQVKKCTQQVVQQPPPAQVHQRPQIMVDRQTTTDSSTTVCHQIVEWSASDNKHRSRVLKKTLSSANLTTCSNSSSSSASATSATATSCRCTCHLQQREPRRQRQVVSSTEPRAAFPLSDERPSKVTTTTNNNNSSSGVVGNQRQQQQQSPDIGISGEHSSSNTSDTARQSKGGLAPGESSASLARNLSVAEAITVVPTLQQQQHQNQKQLPLIANSKGSSGSWKLADDDDRQQEERQLVRNATRPEEAYHNNTFTGCQCVASSRTAIGAVCEQQQQQQQLEMATCSGAAECSSKSHQTDRKCSQQNNNKLQTSDRNELSHKFNDRVPSLSSSVDGDALNHCQCPSISCSASRTSLACQESQQKQQPHRLPPTGTTSSFKANATVAALENQQTENTSTTPLQSVLAEQRRGNKSNSHKEASVETTSATAYQTVASTSEEAIQLQVAASQSLLQSETILSNQSCGGVGATFNLLNYNADGGDGDGEDDEHTEVVDEVEDCCHECCCNEQPDSSATVLLGDEDDNVNGPEVEVTSETNDCRQQLAAGDSSAIVAARETAKSAAAKPVCSKAAKTATAKHIPPAPISSSSSSSDSSTATNTSNSAATTTTNSSTTTTDGTNSATQSKLVPTGVDLSLAADLELVSDQAAAANVNATAVCELTAPSSADLSCKLNNKLQPLLVTANKLTGTSTITTTTTATTIAATIVCDELQHHSVGRKSLLQDTPIGLYWRQLRTQLFGRRQAFNSTESSNERQLAPKPLVVVAAANNVNVKTGGYCSRCGCSTSFGDNKNNNNNNSKNNNTNEHIKPFKRPLKRASSISHPPLTSMNSDSERKQQQQQQQQQQQPITEVAPSSNSTPLATLPLSMTMTSSISSKTGTITNHLLNLQRSNKASTTTTTPTTTNRQQQQRTFAASATNISQQQPTVTPPQTALSTSTNNSVHQSHYQLQAASAVAAAEGLESKRERKAAKTLAIITGVFVMCWLPFFIMAITMPLLNIKPHKYVFALMLWLGYANSMLNPIIYTIFSPDFRKAFKRLLCGLEGHAERRRRQQQQHQHQQQQYNFNNSSYQNSFRETGCLPQVFQPPYRVAPFLLRFCLCTETSQAELSTTHTWNQSDNSGVVVAASEKMMMMVNHNSNNNNNSNSNKLIMISNEPQSRSAYEIDDDAISNVTNNNNSNNNNYFNHHSSNVNVLAGRNLCNQSLMLTTSSFPNKQQNNSNTNCSSNSELNYCSMMSCEEPSTTSTTNNINNKQLQANLPSRRAFHQQLNLQNQQNLTNNNNHQYQQQGTITPSRPVSSITNDF